MLKRMVPYQFSFERNIVIASVVMYNYIRKLVIMHFFFVTNDYER